MKSERPGEAWIRPLRLWCGLILYTGDGVMALFGIEAGPDTPRRDIVAAGAMIERMEALSRVLGGELDSPLRMGIGIHSGPVVVDEMGYAGTRHLTAVGHTVNTASRTDGLGSRDRRTSVCSRALPCAPPG